MNTNGNIYTVIYSTIIVVVVAAVLAFAAMKLKPMQDANVKAETLSQMMLSSGIMDSSNKLNNNEILTKYSESIAEAFTINLNGERNGSLETALENIQLIDNLKPQNIGIKAGGDVTLPVYKFKNGLTVIPIYGAGLWGPIWGYIALEKDLRTIAGVYFDHASETPGLGAKIKDEPSFAAQFVGKNFDLDSVKAFAIVKGGAPAGNANAVDAISGATMTCKGLNEGINVWINAYSKYLINNVEEEIYE